MSTCPGRRPHRKVMRREWRTGRWTSWLWSFSLWQRMSWSSLKTHTHIRTYAKALMYRCKIFMHYWKIKLCLLMKSFFSYLLNEHELSIFLHSYIVSISCIALVYSYLCYFVLTYFTQLDGHPSVYLQVELKETHRKTGYILQLCERRNLCSQFCLFI